MNIRILGTRGEISASAPRHKDHSGMLVDRRYLFDFGERKYLELAPRAIFITHLHPDHAAFVRESFPVPAIPIYAPERKTYPFLRRAKPLTLDGYRVTPIPTVHSVKVKSCAYLIEKGKTRILYTGDIVWMSAARRKKLGRLTAVITEASHLREGGLIRKDKEGRLFGHAGVPNLIRMWKPHTRTIILTHFGSWFFADIRKSHALLAELQQKESVNVVVSRDGMSIDI